jgi:predicted kinase
MKGKLSILLGESHSGKSTFAKKWQRQSSNIPRVVVTTDNIRLALAGKLYTKELEPIVFSHKHVMLKTLLIEGFHVLSCGTNTTKESIKRHLELDPNAEFIVMNTPLDVCLERMKLTGQLNMGPVIKRHHRQLQKLLNQGLENVRAELLEEIRVRWEKTKGDIYV